MKQKTFSEKPLWTMKFTKSQRISSFLITVLIMSVSLSVCVFLGRMFADTNSFTGPLLILAVALISRLTDGYFWGILSSVVGVVGVNVLFTYPYGQFDLTITGYPLTFAAMLLVSILISALTTQTKKQEQLRYEAKKENIRANLLRSISHDLRTPLASILGASSTLIENDSLPEADRGELLRQINRDAQWLVRVSENLLSITRCSGEDVHLKKSDEVLEEIIGSAIVKFRKSPTALPVSVSKPKQLILVPVDATLIEQVLLNLFENVTAHGQRASRIGVTVRQEADRVSIVVSDDGVGISPSRLAGLFDGYGSQPAPHSAQGQRSMGIGLSVCNSIIATHGGAMWAENNKDGGASVGFWLPCEEDDCERYTEG